jgi:hypothetical protein
MPLARRSFMAIDRSNSSGWAEEETAAGSTLSNQRSTESDDMSGTRDRRISDAGNLSASRQTDVHARRATEEVRSEVATCFMGFYNPSGVIEKYLLVLEVSLYCRSKQAVYQQCEKPSTGRDGESGR